MRAAKVLGWVIGGLVAAFVVVLLAVWLFVNPNEFKPKIAAQVKNATGRELTLTGDLKLSVFPWIALEMGPASLGNPPGFGPTPLVAFRHASVRVKLLPLLAKRLEIGRVELDGLDLELQKNAEGKGNWEGFGNEKPNEPTPAAKSAGPLPEIEGIKITNARLRYEKMAVDNFNLETGSFAARSSVPVTLHVEAARGIEGERAVLDARLDLTADPAAKRYTLKAVNFTSSVSLAGNPRPLKFSLTAPAAEADLAAQTLSVPAFTANLDGAQLTGSVKGTSIVDALALAGNVALAPLEVREYLPRLGVALPKTRDSKALSAVSMSTDFTYGKGNAELEKLQATLDDTHLKGSLGLNTTSEAVKFDLAVDKIDLDRYLPPPQPGPPPPATPKPATASKPLVANGTLNVGELHMAPLDLTAVKVTVATQDKVMRIHPLSAQVFGGQYSGDISLDQRNTVPVISMDEHLVGVDVGKLVAAESKKLRVTGRGTVDIKGTARGEGSDAITKSLNGQFDMNVANGAVEGIDLAYELNRAESLIRKQALPGGQSSGKTAFDAFKMSAKITNGVAETKDLIISSKVLKVTGQGAVNLGAKTLDMGLNAETLASLGGSRLQIPVKVTGSMTDPTVRPDIEALAKSQLKNKVQDVLQDKLKGLFH